MPRREFLYDIKFWEARRILRGYRKRGRIFMQLLAENVYASTFAFRGSEGKTVKDMFDYAQHAVEAIQAQRDPDIKKTILAIIACMMAYYEDADKAPVKDSEIMKQATPVEIGTAMLTILSMRSEFYHVPEGEPEEKPEKGGKKRKNA